jgi:hypothetical protein
MIRQRRQLIPLVLALAIITTACPSSNDLDRAAGASNELAHDVLLANRAVAELYKSGRMSLATKDKVAAKLGVIGDKGEKFNNILIELDKKYPQGILPPQDVSFVRENLTQLRALYSDVLADLSLLKAEKVVSKLDKDLTTMEKAVK